MERDCFIKKNLLFNKNIYIKDNRSKIDLFLKLPFQNNEYQFEKIKQR